MKENSLLNLTLELTDIVVADRLREDLGDIEGLAESIRDNGLLHPLVVELQEDGKYHLRTGGRRYAAYTILAANKVESPDPTVFNTVPVRVFNQMPEHQRLKIELEENLRRKGMTWQETVVGIYKYHKACRRAALLEQDDWSQEMTGDLLGMSQANVSVAIRAANEILSGNEAIANCESLKEANNLLFQNRLDELQAEQMRRIELKRKQTIATADSSKIIPLPALPSSIITLSNGQKQESPAVETIFTKEQIASFYHHGNALDVLPKLRQSGTKINHILCDPPYGIDTENFVSTSIERIEATHQVEDNIQLLEKFLQVAYDVIEKDGFLCMWYDLDHHEKIHKWATHTGWRVQRWPLIWCKSTPCRNSQAQYNITKSTEVCYLMRRSEQSVLRSKRSNNYVECAAVNSGSHPFVKPDTIWGVLLDLVSSVGDTVVDPFAGEGSALAASFKRRRIPVGIEIDSTHIASGLSYIQNELNKKSLLDGMLATPPL